MNKKEKLCKIFIDCDGRGLKLHEQTSLIDL